MEHTPDWVSTPAMERLPHSEDVECDPKAEVSKQPRPHPSQCGRVFADCPVCFVYLEHEAEHLDSRDTKSCATELKPMVHRLVYLSFITHWTLSFNVVFYPRIETLPYQLEDLNTRSRTFMYVKNYVQSR
jgi:hypothetical protein